LEKFKSKRSENLESSNSTEFNIDINKDMLEKFKKSKNFLNNLSFFLLDKSQNLNSIPTEEKEKENRFENFKSNLNFNSKEGKKPEIIYETNEEAINGNNSFRMNSNNNNTNKGSLYIKSFLNKNENERENERENYNNNIYNTANNYINKSLDVIKERDLSENENNQNTFTLNNNNSNNNTNSNNNYLNNASFTESKIFYLFLI